MVNIVEKLQSIVIRGIVGLSKVIQKSNISINFIRINTFIS